MKNLILTLTFLLGSMTFAAQKDGMDAEKFAQHKAKILEKLDKRIAAMTENKNCISAAKDMKAMKDCRNKMRENRAEWKGMRMKHKGMRKGMMDGKMHGQMEDQTKDK